MLVDYHIHSVFSDGKSKHQENLSTAIEKGLDEVGFSDHFSIVATDWTTPEYEIDQLKKTVNKIKNLEDLPLNVKFGAEIDFIPGKEEKIRSLINQLPLDYVIGSIHFIDDWNFDTDPEGFDQENIDVLYSKYYNLLFQAVLSDLFDVIGHADLIKKFGHMPMKNPKPFFKKVLKAMKEKDKTYELNTSGLKKPCQEFYPSRSFIEMAFEENIPVTLGSDAHHEKDIAQYFQEAIEMLKEIGYRKIATFEGRKRQMEPL